MPNTTSTADVALLLAKKALAKHDTAELIWYASLNDDARHLVNVLVASLVRQIPGVGAIAGLEIIHAIVHHCYVRRDAAERQS